MPTAIASTEMTRLVPAEPMAGARAAAAAVLRADGLVALPTETVYGLAARAASPAAVNAVFAAKGRPAHNPLIVHVHDEAQAFQLAQANPFAEALAAAFWPGPLTIVLNRREDANAGQIAHAACPGGDTVALRCPASALMRTLSGEVGPLVAPSANRSGQVSATTAQSVLDELGGRIALVIDGGPCRLGIESTVVDLTGEPRILRPGALIASEISSVIGAPFSDEPAPVSSDSEPLRSPGLLTSHYAPRARVRLDVAAHHVRPGEGWLALGTADSAARPEHTVRLSPSGDLHEAAKTLYAGLRTLDAAGVSSIAVSPIPAVGIGIAIRDRLARAAAPRPDDLERPTS